MQHAKAIIKLVKGLDCRFNLIRFHQIPDIPLQVWMMRRWSSSVITSPSMVSSTTIRASRGQDIYAACGLLQHLEKNRRNP